MRGISAFRTPNSQFYRIDTALVIPRVSVDGWKLTIDGDVDRPFSLTFDELLAMPLIERDITLTCVSNEVGGPYVGAARWLGVRTSDLLERAGVRSGVDQIFSHSTEGMTISTPVQALTDDREALVAVAMNGEPLPAMHGFPARLVTPGLYGFVGATKWLTRMEATTYAAKSAYWTDRGWATDSPILTQSRIDTPRGLNRLDAGRVVIGGVAWAQHRGIHKVEVRVDDNAWQEAKLGPDAGIDYWRQWYLPWDAAARPPPADGARDRPQRRRAARAEGDPVPQGRHRLAQHRRHRRVALPPEPPTSCDSSARFSHPPGRDDRAQVARRRSGRWQRGRRLASAAAREKSCGTDPIRFGCRGEPRVYASSPTHVKEYLPCATPAA